MSEQAVNELSTATPNLTDYIMGMSGTAEYKALVSAVAKKIVEDYAGSSLAGSNQSVKAALDSLNSNGVYGRNGSYTGDLNALVTPGYWYCSTNATNIPAGFTAVHLVVFAVSTRVIQVAYQFGGNAIAIRTSANSGSTWGSWFTYSGSTVLTKDYAIARVENPYADATAVNRIKLHRNGRIGTLILNFAPSASVPKTSGFVTIGEFDCKFANTYLVTASSQNDNEAASLTYNIQADGTVQIYNGHSAAATGFFRAVVPVIFDISSN